MALVDVFNECHFHEPYLDIQDDKLIICEFGIKYYP